MNSTNNGHAIQVNSTDATQAGVPTRARLDDRVTGAGKLDLQFTELIEVIWSCERRWTLENRIEAAIRLEGRHGS